MFGDPDKESRYRELQIQYRAMRNNYYNTVFGHADDRLRASEECSRFLGEVYAAYSAWYAS